MRSPAANTAAANTPSSTPHTHACGRRYEPARRYVYSASVSKRGMASISGRLASPQESAKQKQNAEMQLRAAAGTKTRNTVSNRDDAKSRAASSVSRGMRAAAGAIWRSASGQ